MNEMIIIDLAFILALTLVLGVVLYGELFK